MYNKDYLCHYGVPGMRWGRRMRYKEARKEYDRLYDEEYKVENKAAKALEAKMLSYAKNKPAIDSFIASKATMAFNAVRNIIGK